MSEIVWTCPPGCLNGNGHAIYHATVGDYRLSVIDCLEDEPDPQFGDVERGCFWSVCRKDFAVETVICVSFEAMLRAPFPPGCSSLEGRCNSVKAAKAAAIAAATSSKARSLSSRSIAYTT
jgi:hypothetical protein